MAKRKRGARSQAEPSGPNLDVGSSKLRVNSYEDVADSDDEFHLQRDKVLLGEAPDAKRRRTWAEQEEFLEGSDEEVLEDGDESEDDDEMGEAATRRGRGDEDGEDGEEVEDGDEEEGVHWGTAKADLYGADVIETEDQALEEEAEALRLQKKQLMAMSAADYGFDGADWQDDGAAVDGGREALEGDVVTEVLPQLQVDEQMSPAERLKLLRSRYPEFEPLRKELLQLHDAHAHLVVSAAAGEGGAGPYALCKLRAASAYLGALTMYFALLTSPATKEGNNTLAMSAAKLRDHPVMDSLVQCRELWQRASKLPEDQMLDVGEDLTAQSDDAAALDIQQVASSAGRSDKTRKSRAQRHADALQAQREALKAERIAKAEADLADLDKLIAPARARQRRDGKPRVGVLANATDADVGEEAPLTAKEAADKAKRKKSLRFYTSQIAQKVNKRGESGRNAGGDEDVPYRERLKDRQARLNAEAERRGRREPDGGAAPSELGGEMDEEDERQAKLIRAEADNSDYYDLVAARVAKKKADRTAFAEAQRQAATHGGRVVEEETVGPDGKRKITYAIEKNKGLTPHRKKDVRNPRVKKRKKFEEKKKKLASMKPIYRGGEGRGGYGGELTGIKKGVVKSVKL